MFGQVCSVTTAFTTTDYPALKYLLLLWLCMTDIICLYRWILLLYLFMRPFVSSASSNTVANIGQWYMYACINVLYAPRLYEDKTTTYGCCFCYTMKRLGKGSCFYARATPAVYLYMYRFNFKFYDLVFSFVCLLKRYACLSVYEEIHKIYHFLFSLFDSQE